MAWRCNVKMRGEWMRMGELARGISRALIDGGGTWSPLLEETLHAIIRRQRQSLDSSLVSRVIDPHLLRHPSLALGFFHWASQQPGFTHSSLSYRSLLNSLSLSPRHIHSLINSLPHFSLYTSHHAIANSLLASLSSSSSASGTMPHAHQLFDHMITRALPFTTLGLGVFLWRFCPTAPLDYTLSLLDHHHIKSQLNPGGLNGSALALFIVHGLCLAGRPHEAMHMLDVLRKRDCKPDFMAYRVVAEALRATGDVLHVDRVLKMKRKLGVAPRSSDYRRLIFQFISDRLISEAKDLGEVIVAGNFPIEDDVLNALIGSVSTNNPSSALLFFEFLVAKERFPTLLTLSNLSKNLCKHGNHDQLLQVSKILSAKDYFVDMDRYNVMLSFFCKAGKVKEAYQLLQEMKKKGLGPDISSYNYVMEACCKEDMIRPAKRLWDEMFANGCEPNLKTCNILITKFSEIDQLKEAHMLFCHMLERGVQPDATTYDVLIKGFCQDNQLEAAIEVFKKSFEQDSEIAKTVLEKFILYLCKKGEFMVASNLVHDYSCTSQRRT